MDKVLWLSKATLVLLNLAFLYASVTASSEPTVRDCVWTQSVTGQVLIKDKSTLNTLGTIFERQLCPTNVTFSSCTACVNDQSNITISCHVIGDLPEFMLEYGIDMHGVIDEPHLKGCKKKVIEKKETAVRDCVWMQSVTGRVIIKDKTTLNTLGTISERQLCPTNVTFSNCTACVNDQSNITISCQVIGDDLPEFMLEYGNGKRGVTNEPHLKGCKKKVIEKEETEIQSDRQSKTQLERQRSSLLAPFLAFLACLLLLLCSWVFYRVWKKL